MRRIFLCFLCVLSLAIPVRGAEAAPKYVALTFDDGPSGRYTRRLLEGLEERGTKATFFLCGYRLEQFPDIAQDIADAGHEIGLHGFTHKSMKDMSRRQIAKEINDCLALVPEDCEVKFMRPPGGCCSDGVHQVTEACGLAIGDWSVDPRDWATRDTAAVGRQVVSQVQDGDVVLLHDMTDSSVDAALAIIDKLERKGFTFVTLSELARLRGVRLKPGQTYRHFPPVQEQEK